jgi:hypothetical protein
MADALQSSPEGETAAGMSQLSERLCSLGLSEGPEASWSPVCDKDSGRLSGRVPEPCG